MSARVVIYTTRSCGYCFAAMRLLSAKGVDVEQIDVSGDYATRAELVERTGRRTVPQIFINEVSIGGYTDLAALDRAGRLDAMLAEPPPSPA